MVSARTAQKQVETSDFEYLSDSCITKVLLAIDDSESSSLAAKTAVSLAANLKAELIILSVLPYTSFLVPTRIGHAQAPVSSVEYYEKEEKRAWNWINDTVLLARKLGVKKARGRVLRSSGSTVRTIVQNAEEERVDLIVTGTRGLRGIRKALGQSVSRGVIDSARCSVLVVR